jgi:hypothetical protein
VAQSFSVARNDAEVAVRLPAAANFTHFAVAVNDSQLAVTFVTSADNDIIFVMRIVMAPIVVMFTDVNAYWTHAGGTPNIACQSLVSNCVARACTRAAV